MDSSVKDTTSPDLLAYNPGIAAVFAPNPESTGYWSVGIGRIVNLPARRESVPGTLNVDVVAVAFGASVLIIHYPPPSSSLPTWMILCQPAISGGVARWA